MMEPHRFTSSANPRTTGCAKCARRLDDQIHANSFKRDPRLEAETIKIAARKQGYDGQLLAVLACQRADAGGDYVEDRQLSWEAVEEIGDCANYCVWEDARHRIRGFDDPEEARLELFSALGHVAAAYEHLRRYRAMLD